jgi:hypothetical protein
VLKDYEEVNAGDRLPSRQRSEPQAYAIDCVIVAGEMPTDPSKISSFEMVHSQHKDVRIVTFDELVFLREMLTGDRAMCCPFKMTILKSRTICTRKIRVRRKTIRLSRKAMTEQAGTTSCHPRLVG